MARYNLPPNEDFLEKHLKRANYQAAIWKSSLCPANQCAKYLQLYVNALLVAQNIDVRVRKHPFLALNSVNAFRALIQQKNRKKMCMECFLCENYRRRILK